MFIQPLNPNKSLNGRGIRVHVRFTDLCRSRFLLICIFSVIQLQFVFVALLKIENLDGVQIVLHGRSGTVTGFH